MAHPATTAFALAGAVGVTALQVWGFIAAANGGASAVSRPTLVASAASTARTASLLNGSTNAFADLPVEVAPPTVPPFTTEANGLVNYGVGPEIVITGTVDRQVSQSAVGFTSALAPEARETKPSAFAQNRSPASRLTGSEPQ